MVSATITAIAAADIPNAVDQHQIWDDHFRYRYGTVPLGGRVWKSTGIDTRHIVVDPRCEDVSEWPTGRRMDRYQAEARPLGAAAVKGALAQSGLSAADVDLFVVVSCTGYATPGLDLVLAAETGMSDRVQRLCIGHMGCYASVPALGTVFDAVVARGLTAVMLSAEITSLHAQPVSRSVEQLVAHALFADAVVATVVQPGPEGAGRAGGLRLVDIAARTDATHQDDMSWLVTDLGFRMTLSSHVPDVLARHVRPMVHDMLGSHGLAVDQIAAWAVHPGGPKILDVCQDALGLDDDAMAPSVAVLRENGNCSSATVMLILDRIRTSETLSPGDYVMALAFGPGLTLYAALLQAS